MGIPVQSRWWVLTLAVVGILVLISALALDRPNVIWAGESPQCPHCRHEVNLYSHRCADCDGEFDWVVPNEDESPISTSSLSTQEAEWVRDRIKALTPDVAAERVAAATELSVDAAKEYLAIVGRGDCGWCGGTRIDLAQDLEADEECPACFARGDCVGSGGDRLVSLGDQRAAKALRGYERELHALLHSRVPDEVKRAEARRLASQFLTNHEGTREASKIRFWPLIISPRVTGRKFDEGGTIVEYSRRRLDKILHALRDENG